MVTHGSKDLKGLLRPFYMTFQKMALDKWKLRRTKPTSICGHSAFFCSNYRDGRRFFWALEMHPNMLFCIIPLFPALYYCSISSSPSRDLKEKAVTMESRQGKLLWILFHSSPWCRNRFCLYTKDGKSQIMLLWMQVHMHFKVAWCLLKNIRKEF